LFERFTERARQVVVLAQDEARGLRHNYIGTEHLLLALLREEEGVAARVLEAFDLTVEDVRGHVEQVVGRGTDPASGQIPFTPRAKKVLELSLREAMTLGHSDIGPEHILLGIARENSGVASRILLDFDAEADRIRAAVIGVLGGMPPSEAVQLEPKGRSRIWADEPGRLGGLLPRVASFRHLAGHRRPDRLGHLGPLSDTSSRWGLGAAARRWDALAIAAIVAGAVFRLVWALAVHPPFDYAYSDMGGYVGRAMRLAEGGPFERYDAFYPPGTHLLLGGVFRVFGADQTGLWAGAAVWGLLSAATPFFMWRLARLLVTPAAAALTALFTAAWPLHATSAGYFLSETPALAFLLAGLWAGYASVKAEGRRALLLAGVAGLLGGAAVTMRPQFLLNLVLLATAWLVAERRLRLLATFAASAAVMIGGAIAHNSLVAEQPTGISENTGITFFIGQCEVHTVRAARGGKFGPPPANQQNRGNIYHFPSHEVWDQPFFFEQGIECIREDGWSHLGLWARSVPDMLWTSILWPQVNDSNLRGIVNVTNVLYAVLLPLMLVGTALIIRDRRHAGAPSGELILLLHLATVLATAFFFFGDPRFRMPYDFFGLALMAAVLADTFMRRRARSAVDSPRL
jgi:4-amino-4-deoxy-L-arabinose transferase-like glycosyltransferase